MTRPRRRRARRAPHAGRRTTYAACGATATATPRHTRTLADNQERFPAELVDPVRFTSAWARQPRDRTLHRRRRDLPRRRLTDPARLNARHRSQRWAARRAQRHQPEVDGTLSEGDQRRICLQIKTRRSSSSRP